MNIKNIVNLGFRKGILIEASRGDVKALPIFKRIFKFLNIANAEPGCCESDLTYLPVGYNKVDGTPVYYDPETDVKVPYSSGGGSARFGVSGEDDTANEDRGFFLNGHFVNFNGLYTNVAIFDRNGDNIILSAMDGGATSADFIISPERISSTTDIAITESTKGFVLMSPDNNYWRITVDNFGALTTTLIP